MNTPEQFKNQPRLGHAIRQRSHSTKELTTMLQQLQLSVQLMPLNTSHSNQSSNLQSTSEEECDSMNSNEGSSSEDEAFGDFDDDYEFNSTFDDNLKSFQSIKESKNKNKSNAQLSHSFTSGLFYPRNLRLTRRRSSSLGNLSRDNDYFDEYDDDEFNRSFESSRTKYSSSLKDLNDLEQTYNSLNLIDFFKNSKNEFSELSGTHRNNDLRRSNSKMRSSNLMRKGMKAVKSSSHQSITPYTTDNRIYENIWCGQSTNNQSNLLVANRKKEKINKNHHNEHSNTTSHSDKRLLLSSQQRRAFKSIGGGAYPANNIDCTSSNMKTSTLSSSWSSGVGCYSIRSSADINNVVNFKSSVSSCKASGKHSSNKKQSAFKSHREQTSSFDQLSLISSSLPSNFNFPSLSEFAQVFCDDHKDTTKNSSSLVCESTNTEKSTTEQQVSSSSSINNKITTNNDEQFESPSKTFIESNSETKGFKNCDFKSIDELSLNQQKQIDQITEDQSSSLDQADDLDELKSVLLNKPQYRLSEQVRKSTKLQLKSSDLPVVREEIQPNQKKMQTLAETQYNQLSYHIAALSCVCDNNKPYSPFQSQSANQPSSVDNSPNSSEYSSPYSSPPSSPSSVSSYSSAEEDCSILSSSPKHSPTSSLNSKNVNSNQSLANLITVNQTNESTEQQPNNGIDEVDCATQFQQQVRQHSQGLLTAAATNLAKLNDLNNNDKVELISNDGSQLDNESIMKTTEQPQTTKTDQNCLASQNTQQVRVRKTSILRNQAPDLANYCKKEVKFADTLGFALEKIKYFPPSSPQVKPKRHSVNLASLQRDYYDEAQELLILHSRPQTKDNQTLAKEFEERSVLYSKQQSKLNLNTNIFGNHHSTRGTYSPPLQSNSSNNFWATYSSTYQSFPIRDEYCGDMFYQPFDSLNVNTQLNNANSTAVSNQSTSMTTLSTSQSSLSYKSPSGLNFMNNQASNSSLFNFSQQGGVSFLPLNFGQPYIQSDFPNRLRTQSVLLHSLDVVGNTVNGIISVMNLTFEKKISVQYTLNKWATENKCEARYSKKDCDNSDKFVFQITLKETDFPHFQLNEDRTMMFAIRYETGNGRVYWDNNYGQDYRLKCKFN